MSARLNELHAALPAGYTVGWNGQVFIVHDVRRNEVLRGPYVDVMAGIYTLPALCKQCRMFYSRFRCSAATHGECDCPRCQGYCECRLDASKG